MGTYTGTNGIDKMRSGYVTEGVTRVPANSFPSDEPDTLTGLASNDTLEGEGGNDTLYGGTGDDTLDGDNQFTKQGGDDVLYGEEGKDWLRGRGGNDTLYGGTEDDRVDGDAGNDKIYGDDGKDDLRGGLGDDTLNGGGGQDYLRGGDNSDIFDFDTVSDSGIGKGNRDSIMSEPYVGATNGFQFAVDKIDVSTIDANVSLAGDQAFEFKGTALPTGPGQLTLFNDGESGDTIVQLNTDDDLEPESEIAIDDGPTVFAAAYSASDFVLSPVPPELPPPPPDLLLA